MQRQAVLMPACPMDQAALHDGRTALDRVRRDAPAFDRSATPSMSPAFHFAIVGISTALCYLYLTRWLGRAPDQTIGSFFYSLTLLPTEGFPFYDIGWSLQHEIAFYLLAACIRPFFGIVGLAAILASGFAADHLFVLPWPLHQYFSYYGDFLAGVAAFATASRVSRIGVMAPIALSTLVFYLQPAMLPLCAFLALLGFINMRGTSIPARTMAALGDASYSIYLIHPLVFYYVYVKLQPPLPPIWSQEFLRYGSLAIVCLLSIASWKWFESPIIAFGNRIAFRNAVKPSTDLPRGGAMPWGRYGSSWR